MNRDGAFRSFSGGRIDRDKPIGFEFNGEQYSGFAGDTLASALLASGVHLVGRSFKYHRPRGILSAGAEEPNALVQLESGAFTQPNLRATQVELYVGLSAHSQNCWPSVQFDVGALNNLLSGVIPAGFYYKTFMWPPSLWMTYEALIRRVAGLGRAPDEADPDVYDKMHAHCDVLIVGAGPAGLAAALAAARTGARVIIADEQFEHGGSLLGSRDLIDDAPALEWAARVWAELATMSNVRRLLRTSVFAYFDHNYLAMVERLGDHLPPGSSAGQVRQRLWKVRARQVVLACGAHERPLVFHNNDLPGVMLAGAVRTYLNRFAVRCGQQVVVFTNNDSAWDAAFDLSDAGCEVCVVDAREDLEPQLLASASSRGIEVLQQHVVVAAQARRKRIHRVEIARLDGSGHALSGSLRRMDCDLLCMSGGWSPAVHLHSQSGARVVFDEQRCCFVPDSAVQAACSAGAANGTVDLDFVLAEGREAGKSSAEILGFRRRAAGGLPKVDVRRSAPMRALWQVPLPARKHAGKCFVDFQNDVSAADIRLAAREGYRSIEHTKRYTTVGMGTDQGKTSNVNALAILGDSLGRGVADVGTTTFRPPYTPVTFGALAGRDLGALMDPVRRTAMHGWHEANGAVFEDVGQWKRPWYYPQAGEGMRAAVNRECVAARRAIGILDASTLGKIDIRGPDAAQFLNKIYTNGWTSLALGRGRYGLMCTEDGMVFDDGVTFRTGDERFLMHTTSGNAARVLAWLEQWLQTEWPHLKVYCNSVTEQWATASICGALAGDLLSRLSNDIDLCTDVFPFMSMREGTVAGLPARVMRVSFTGELSYEISVPADYGLSLWTTLMSAGARYGITAFGTETMHVLRAEKGFIIAGQETDGTVTPIDLGLQGMVSRRKDFIGRRSLARVDSQRTDRKQLVGLLTDDPHCVLPEGAQVVEQATSAPPTVMIGHVTSSYWSENLAHSVALAMIENGRQRHGEQIRLPLRSGVVTARICAPVFFDVAGERING
ncbi:MAG: sarcosine oxidase subunit alpha [Gammaproteobacteria bacterium]|jgi:sarcosine oxidase subunit alpha